jgi:hypothetical protein
LTLAPHESCTLTVFFEPAEPGQASGALWLHNTTANPDQLVTFYGRGVDAQAGTAALAFSPAVADFGAQAVGSESAALTLALVNTGAATLLPSFAAPRTTRPRTAAWASRSRPALAARCCSIFGRSRKAPVTLIWSSTRRNSPRWRSSH